MNCNKKYDYAKSALTECIYRAYDRQAGDILIIGRNNRDINYYLDDKKFKLSGDSILSYEYPNISIRYMTVHKSKGLESDNVILINMVDDTLGFPNQMKDDQILRFVSPHASKYPFDEERRLFYVALTRTKNRVYILSPRKNKSPFIAELMRDYDSFIEKA